MHGWQRVCIVSSELYSLANGFGRLGFGRALKCAVLLRWCVSFYRSPAKNSKKKRSRSRSRSPHKSHVKEI